MGSDPEFFIVSEDNTPISAVLIAEGTKEEPKDIGDGFFVQRDNLALEGNIPPAKTKEEFISSMKHLKKYFNDKLDIFGARITNIGEAEFPEYIAMTPEGQEFGCSQIIYGWHNNYYDIPNILEINSADTPSLADSNVRTAGFHVHIGYEILENDHKFTKMMVDTIIAKLFDLFLILPSQCMIKEPYRNSTYGLLGNYRSKPYGIECRALSSYFTDDKFLGWVWESVEDIFTYFNTLTEDDIRALLNISTYSDPSPEFVEELLYRWKKDEIYYIIQEQTTKLKRKINTDEAIYSEKVLKTA